MGWWFECEKKEKIDDIVKNGQSKVVFEILLYITFSSIFIDLRCQVGLQNPMLELSWAMLGLC